MLIFYRWFNDGRAVSSSLAFASSQYVADTPCWREKFRAGCVLYAPLAQTPLQVIGMP